MLKFFLRLLPDIQRRASQLQAIENYMGNYEEWRRDPLAHPAIAAMSERERADLPFNATRNDPDRAGSDR